jgi:ubiquinone/menaquinone biosynthesis C-methylase UbiE
MNSNKDIKLAKSLSADNLEIIDYIPYLLQDIIELGAIAQDVLKIINQIIPVSTSIRVLDLGCGKGAVSHLIAQYYEGEVIGVDLMEAFIDEAKERAKSLNVKQSFRFEVMDIRQAIGVYDGFDVVIFASVGNIFDDLSQMLNQLKKVVKPNGFIIIDDAISKYDDHSEYETMQSWKDAIEQSNLRMIDHEFTNENQLKQINAFNQAKIIKRANELKQRHPHLAQLFDNYVKSQEDEIDDLENNLISITWVLQRKDDDRE